MIAKRINHKGNCDHAQTPYARRVCRKAMIAAAALAVETPTYRAGDEITIDGVTIALCTRHGSHGIRWTWWCDAKYIGGETYLATAEEAIESARRTLAGPRCSCGAPATMAASTRHTCVNCYDRYAA